MELVFQLVYSLLDFASVVLADHSFLQSQKSPRKAFVIYIHDYNPKAIVHGGLTVLTAHYGHKQTVALSRKDMESLFFFFWGSSVCNLDN